METPSRDPVERPKENKQLSADELLREQVRNEHDADVLAYHRKYLYEPSKEKEDMRNPKIFRLQVATTQPPKGTIVLFLGNLEPLDDATVITKQKDKGATKLMERLTQDGDYNVVMIRTTQMPGPTALSAKVIEQHTMQLIGDMNTGRGVFRGATDKDGKLVRRMDLGPTVSFFGYSYGGGMMNKVIDEWDKLGGRANIGKTAALDAVKFGSFAIPQKDRPTKTAGHLQFYQTALGLAKGAPLDAGQKWNTLVDQNDKLKVKDHSAMHNAKDNPDIHKRIYEHLTGRTWDSQGEVQKAN